MPAPAWQHPYADVFKLMSAGTVSFSLRGDVTEMLDKTIRRKVFSLRGKVAASNHISAPAESTTESLLLTGRYVYVQLRRAPGESATFHLEILTQKRSVLRISFSTIYTAVRSMGVNLRVPLVLSDKWTVLAIDMHRVLAWHTCVAYNREGYACVKSLQICCSMNIRGVFTSDIIYMPETLPKGMELPLLKTPGNVISDAWNTVYDWVWLPEPQSNQPPVDNDKPRSGQAIPAKLVPKASDEAESLREPISVKVTPPSSPSCGLLHEQSTTAPSSPAKVPPPQPYESLALSKLDHEAQLQTHRSTVLQKADLILKRAGLHRPPAATAATPASPKLYYSPSKYGPRIVPHANAIWPERVLTLDRVIGLSRHCGAVWCQHTKSFVYASDATIVVAERVGSDQLHESFLFGHSAPVALVTFVPATGLLVSVEDGPSPSVRFWSVSKLAQVGWLRGHPNGVSALAVSRSGSLLCLVGKDAHHRTQLLVYDVSSRAPSFPVVAKQTSDFAISRIYFSTYEPERLVSCGRENIRFWRLKGGHLPGCPVVLHEYARDNTFTAVAFDPVAAHGRPLYVASTQGTLFVLDYDSMVLTCVYKLHDGAIASLAVNAGFCVTGSRDGLLRVWPLDFSDFYLEARHDHSVESVDLSGDGMQVLAVCANGTIGVLDVPSQQYAIVLRSHTAEITALALSPSNSTVVSVGKDHSIRVWDVATGLQTYEFKTEVSVGTCIAHHPTADKIAVGFASGVVRLLDIPTMTILETYQQHTGAVLDVHFGLQSAYSSGADRQICCYQSHSSTVHSVRGSFLVAHGRFCIDAALQCIAIGADDGAAIDLVDMFSLRSRRRLTHADGKGIPMALSVLTFVRHEHVLALLAASHRLLLFSPTTGAVVQTWASVCDGPLGDLTLSPLGRYVIAGRTDTAVLKVILLEHPHQLRLTQTCPGQSAGTRQVVVSTDGRTVVSCGAGAALLIWGFNGYEDDLRAEGTESAADDVDEAALFEIHHKTDNQLDIGLDSDDEGDEDEPNELVPTPTQRPQRRAIAKGDLPKVIPRASQTWAVREQRRTGFNLAAAPAVTWSAKHGVLLRASGSAVLVDEIAPGRQHCLEHHREGNEVAGVLLSPSQDRAVSWAGSCLCFFDVCDVACATATTIKLPVPNFEIVAVAFAETDNRVWCVARTTDASAALYVVDGDSAVLAEATELVSSARQLLWIGGTRVDAVTTSPLQGWKFNAASALIERVPLSAEITLLATATTFSDGYLLGWSVADGKLHFVDTTRNMILCSVALHHVKHQSPVHIGWVRGRCVVVATERAPCLWVYALSGRPDWEAIARDGLRLVSRVNADVESNVLRLDAPVISASWYGDGFGVVVTASGTVWAIEPDAMTKSVLKLSDARTISALGRLPTEQVATLSGTSLRVWDANSLREVCTHLSIDTSCEPSAFAASEYGCVVGYSNGVLAIFKYRDGVWGPNHTCTPWAMESDGARTKLAQRRCTSDVGIDILTFLRGTSVVLVGNSTGHLVVLSLDTLATQWVSLPFGAEELQTLRSQNGVQVGGRLVHCSGASEAVVIVWTAQSEKSHLSIYTGGGSVLQDAWKLPQVAPEAAWAVLSPHHDSVVFYPTLAGLEGRCFQRRQVTWQCTLTPPPTTGLLVGAHLFMSSPDGMQLIDLREMTLSSLSAPSAFVSAVAESKVCLLDGVLYIAHGNRLYQLRLESTECSFGS
ncbi:WD repeat-containing protein 90 [Achlya hypogyna]|uniref:WD repeat-containing protein 90 n=1 Tax=Achlya hypogyna TaxID=1202772 RepID=A0A1V9YPV8_ACHHY|nr:WD repeat-containing protein 90 [Achlya hypogyna]